MNTSDEAGQCVGFLPPSITEAVPGSPMPEPQKTYSRSRTDWSKEIKPEEFVGSKERPSVPLKVLRRLTRLAGIRSSYPVEVKHVVDGKGNGMVQCIYQTEYEDGSVFGGCADVNKLNTKDEFTKFPTATAESRAEARAHIKALGLDLHATEEFTDSEEGYTGTPPSNNAKIDGQQLIVIEALLEDKKIKPIDLITAIVKERECFDLHSLTQSEAVAAMDWLNGQPAPAKRSKRDEKKASLENALENQ